ncbi:MAG: hypothetical protein LBJ48_03975 [Coriobacteriales bacterium]|jgi:hypothetical protein|nr:hypothetical protein [Coriobacteriales bacterium]
MKERDTMPSEAGAFGSRIGGLLLVFVVGCIADIVCFPVGMIVGIATGLTPSPHPAVAAFERLHCLAPR